MVNYPKNTKDESSLWKENDSFDVTRSTQKTVSIGQDQVEIPDTGCLGFEPSPV